MEKSRFTEEQVVRILKRKLSRQADTREVELPAWMVRYLAVDKAPGPPSISWQRRHGDS